YSHSIPLDIASPLCYLVTKFKLQNGAVHEQIRKSQTTAEIKTNGLFLQRSATASSTARFRILQQLGFAESNKGKTSGSRVKFYRPKD
ncbi:MAG: hypothetical protein IKR28_08860, partial [Selenomonadaceae bacterium]|nr:hypothetical protein [Selenomonadaceae bacterium]